MKEVFQDQFSGDKMRTSSKQVLHDHWRVVWSWLLINITTRSEKGNVTNNTGLLFTSLSLSTPTTLFSVCFRNLGLHPQIYSGFVNHAALKCLHFDTEAMKTLHMAFNKFLPWGTVKLKKVFPKLWFYGSCTLQHVNCIFSLVHIPVLPRKNNNSNCSCVCHTLTACFTDSRLLELKLTVEE